MIDNNYNDLAMAIAAKTNQDIDNKKCFDPMTILTIIGIIISIIKCYLNRKLTKEQAIQRIKNPGLLDRMFLKRIVTKELNKRNRPVFFGQSFSKYKVNLTNALLEIGEKATDAQFNKLLDQYEDTISELNE